jgi:hypothetical protein
VATTAISSPSELATVDDGLTFYVGCKQNKVTRRIEQSYSNTRFGQAFGRMSQSKDHFAQVLTNAFEKSYKTGFPNLERTLIDSIFAKSAELFAEQQVSWYLREFFTTIRRVHQSNHYSSYLITLQSCRDYSFYSLEASQEDGKNSALLQVPFFVKSTPSEDTEKEVIGYRGLADILLMLSPNILACDDNQPKLFELIKWFRIRLDCIPTGDEGPNSLKLIARPVVTCDKYITLPPDYQKVLVSSPNFRNAMSDMSEIWSAPKAKSALLCAWTGSGKEVLVDLLMNGMRLSQDERIVVSASELGRFSNLRATILKKFNRKRALLFLDEIHHSSAQDLRTGLLRLMETGKLEVSKGGPVDCSAIFYMLGASITPPRARLLNPTDLWTRMEYTVTLHHPLLIKERSERIEVLRDYFVLFWTLQSNDWGTNDSDRSIASLITEEGALSKLSEIFARRLESPLIPLVSLRIVRSVVKRLFARTVDYVREHSQGDDTSDALSAVQEVFGGWVDEIFTELIPENISDHMF